jgi:hypothetical protein
MVTRTEMIHVAIIRRNKVGTVLDVEASEVSKVVAAEKAAGSTIIGAYVDPRQARKAMLLGIEGYRPRFNVLSDPRFKSYA